MTDELVVTGLEPLVELAVLGSLGGAEIAEGIEAPYKGTLDKAYKALGIFLSYRIEPDIEPISKGSIKFHASVDDKDIFVLIGRSDYQINVTKEGWGTIASIGDTYMSDYFLENLQEYVQIFWSNLN